MMMTLTRHWPCRQQWQYPGATLGNSIIIIFWIVVLIIIKIVIIIIGSSSSDDCKDQPINHHPPHWPRHFSAIVDDLHRWSYLLSENDQCHHIDHNEIPQDNAHGHDDKSDKTELGGLWPQTDSGSAILLLPYNSFWSSLGEIIIFGLHQNVHFLKTILRYTFWNRWPPLPPSHRKLLLKNLVFADFFQNIQDIESRVMWLNWSDVTSPLL